jgi:hypothetical protein
LKNKKTIKEQEIDINTKKLDLANAKIAVLEDEKNIYLREKNDLVKDNAEESEIAKFDSKIAETNSEISAEKEKLADAKSVISNNQQWLDEFSTLKDNLSNMMASEYDKKRTIDSFTQNEIKRLNKEKMAIAGQKEQLVKTQKKLTAQKSKVSDDLESIDNEITLLSSSELSEVLEKKSQINMDEALLAQQELDISKGLEYESTTGENLTPENLSILEELENEIKNRRAELESMKYQLVNERIDLANKQAELDAKRAKKAGAAKFIGIIILVGALAIGGLYLLGRTRRRKKKAAAQG